MIGEIFRWMIFKYNSGWLYDHEKAAWDARKFETTTENQEETKIIHYKFLLSS